MSSLIAGLLRGRGDSEAMNSQSLSNASLKEGKQWRFREVFELAASTGSQEFVIDNTLSDSKLRVVVRDIDPDEKIGGSVSLNPTIDTAGTDFRVVNNKIEAPPIGAPSFTVEYGGTYSDLSQDLPLRSPGGADPPGPATAGTRSPNSAAFALEPGASIHYEITEESGNANTVTVEFVISVA